MDVYRIRSGHLQHVTGATDRDMNGSVSVRQVDFLLSGRAIALAGNFGGVRIWQVPEGVQMEPLIHNEGQQVHLDVEEEAHLLVDHLPVQIVKVLICLRDLSRHLPESEFRFQAYEEDFFRSCLSWGQPSDLHLANCQSSNIFSRFI